MDKRVRAHGLAACGRADINNVGFLFLAAVLFAQLEPLSGTPLSAQPAQTSGETVLVRLPRSFGMSVRVVAHHGTAMYKLPAWKAVCPGRGGKPQVTFVDGALFEERHSTTYAVRTMSRERDFPLSCKLQPVRGRFTLILADPGRKHSPALAARTPDYIVP